MEWDEIAVDMWRDVQLSSSTKLLAIPSGYVDRIQEELINAKFGGDNNRTPVVFRAPDIHYFVGVIWNW